MLDRIQEACSLIQRKASIEKPIEQGIILGSGLGDFVEIIEDPFSMPYEEIPYFPVSTVEGHAGELIVGKVAGVDIIALKGRFHYYEGYDLKEATFPLRVFKQLGVKRIFLSNASGGLNPKQQIGDLMLIEDHIHLFPDNPLRGRNDEKLGPRFPDMSDPYAKCLRKKALQLASELNIKLHEGIYLGTPGPTYETPAEYRYFREIGADAVGMSTTAETIVARHADMDVLGISVISDMGVEGQIVEISHEEVQEVASSAAPRMAQLFKALIRNLN